MLIFLFLLLDCPFGKEKTDILLTIGKVVQIVSNGKNFSSGNPLEPVNNWIQLFIPRINKFFRELLNPCSPQDLEIVLDERSNNITNKQAFYLFHIQKIKDYVTKNKKEITKTMMERFKV